MTPRYWLLVPSIVLGCSGARYDNSQGPSMTMPARLAEGRNADAGAPQVEAGAPMVSPSAPPNAQPDPVALKEPIQWEYVVEYDRGALRVVSAKRLDFKKPIPTARNMGRFAIELWIGRELIERVRFDFPLLGAEEPIGKRRPLKQPPTFAAGATVQRKLLVPDSRRATRAVLVDRATGSETVLPWPPDAPLPPHRANSPRADRDAGAASDAAMHGDGGV